MNPRTTEDDADPAADKVAQTIIHDSELAQQRKPSGRDLAMRIVAAAVADAIGLLMRSDRHRHYSLADLEWLLLPPLKLDQVAFAYVRPTLDGAVACAGKSVEAPPVAVAMVTWAAVSPEVAAKLNAQKKAGHPYRLAPHEWRSGNEARIIDTIGDEKRIKDLVEKVRQKLETKGDEVDLGVPH